MIFLKHEEHEGIKKMMDYTTLFKYENSKDILNTLNTLMVEKINLNIKNEEFYFYR